MRCAGLRSIHADHDLADAQLAFPEKRQDLDAAGIGQGLEYLRFHFDFLFIQLAGDGAQLIDLALLQNGMLKGAALDAFLKRSVDLIK